MAAGRPILIIADASRVAEVYASKLRRGGCHVNVAPDGMSGFDLAVPLPPDAIILDIDWPRLPRSAGTRQALVERP
jgi:DNA-binding response OmpR family regulator